MPITPEQATFIVPLLLVITERLTNLTRNSVKGPDGFADSQPLFLPTNQLQSDTTGGRFRRPVLPQLGQLNSLHTTNVAVLSGAFILVVATQSGLIRNVLALVVVLIWLQLPLLEIGTYSAIQDRVDAPRSLYIHLVSTIAIVAYIAGFGGFRAGLFLDTLDILSPSVNTVLQQREQLGAVVLLVLLILGSSLGFLWLFEREVSANAGSGSEVGK